MKKNLVSNLVQAEEPFKGIKNEETYIVTRLCNDERYLEFYHKDGREFEGHYMTVDAKLTVFENGNSIIAVWHKTPRSVPEVICKTKHGNAKLLSNGKASIVFNFDPSLDEEVLNKEFAELKAAVKAYCCPKKNRRAA